MNVRNYRRGHGSSLLLRHAIVPLARIPVHTDSLVRNSSTNLAVVLEDDARS